MVEFHDLPRLPRRNPAWIIILLVALALLIVFPLLARWTTEYLWYQDVQRGDVYWTMFWGRWLLGGIVGIGFFLLVFANVYLALRETSDTTWRSLGVQLRERSIGMLDRTVRRVIYWSVGLITGLFALGVGRGAADYWPQFLLFMNSQPVGTADPAFKHDIGFYLFQLPVWELIERWLFFSLILALIFAGIVYLTTGSIRKLRGATISSGMARVHLSILLALVFLTKGMDYYLDRFSLLYSNSGLFVGAGYADMHAKLPGLHLMLALAVIAAAITLIGIAFRNIKLLGWYVAGMMVMSIVVLGIYPAMVQRFRVDPDERKQEAPYIQRHIDMTRQAYGLDKVREVPFSPVSRVTTKALQTSPVTVNNVRLWDTETLAAIYRQRQELRTYYQIINVDIDRYQLDGQLRQVMLAAREMNSDQIPGKKTWVNRHLIYTHGHGVVMSPVNTFNPNKGEPVYILKDIPPVSQHPQLQITRPEIYFGEAMDEYIVVNTTEKEFDYQRGENESVETVYQSKDTGISLRNRLVRMVLASRFGALNLLISPSINSESRLLFRRQIMERAQAIAPFLVFDRDPYVVIGKDGRLYWMLDTYTRSIRYPYAEYTNLEIANGQTVRSNYVRNPVKIVIDAYTGDATLYVVDETEPFIRAWQKVFPRLFKPLSAMPAGLQEHVRVPEGMFNSVSEIYRRYHMTKATDFYRNVDLWTIASESGQSNEQNVLMAPTPLPAYYNVMSLPGSTRPEYLLMRPYTPTGENKDNMISWLSARNDPEGFGEMLVYKFPAQSSFYGPAQFERRLNQVPEISEAFGLWDRAGSSVRKGNLLVIPIADTLLYVRPIYLQAAQSPIPELQRVIVADQERVVMRRSLEEALAALAGGAVNTPSPPPTERTTTQTPSATPPAPTADQRAIAKSALEHLNRAKAAQREDDWATYGREMEAMRRDLEKLAK
ncbi:MAG: UPF0182 family membrane protein [Armatimonadota bacterium]